MRDYPWRHLGVVTHDQIVDELEEQGSPILCETIGLVYYAREHSYLLLRQLWVESKYATEGRLVEYRNPLGLRPRPDKTYSVHRVVTLPDKGRFLVFASFTDCVAEWYERIVDPTYAYARTSTVEEFVHTFAPSSDGNDEVAYVSAIYAGWYRLQPRTPLVLFCPGKRVFTSRAATVRLGPSRDDAIVKHLTSGTTIYCRGWRRGEEVAGEDRWLQLAGRTPQYIHASGVREPF